MKTARAPLLGVLLLSTACASTPSQAPQVAAAATALADGDEVAYRIEEGGRVVGRLHARYVKSADRRQLISRVVYGAARPDGSIIPVRTTEYATSLRMDFTPLSFKRLCSRDGRLSLSFRGSRLAKTTDLDAKEIVIEDAPSATPHARDDIAQLALLLEKSGLKAGSSGRLELRDLATGELETPLVQVFSDRDRRTVLQLPSGKATFDSDGWVKRFDDKDGRSYVRLSKAGSAPKLLPIPAPLRYRRPSSASWRDRDVLIDVEGAQLAGTLSVPRSQSQWTSGMAPAVVFISDLPLQNRHGHAAVVDFGTWRLLDTLAEAGFAVLRIDDRGVDGSKVTSAAVKDDLRTAVADALACLDFMKRQPHVDPDQTFVLGHGFGARVAAEVASQRELRALILLAPAYRSVGAVLAEPLVQIAGVDSARAERRMRLVVQGLTGNEAAQGQSSAEDLARYRPVAQRLASYVAQDVAVVLEKVDEPVAVFQGMRDFETSWNKDAKRLVDAMNARHRRQAKLFIYELVDHQLKTESTRSTPERYLDRGRNLDPDLLKALTRWMRQKAAAKGM